MGARSAKILLLCLLSVAAASPASAQNYWSAFVSGRGGLFHTQFPEADFQATDGLANVSASLAYSRYTRTSIFTLSGWTSGLFVSDFNFGNYSVSASGAKQVGPQLDLNFAGGISNGFNYQDLIINGIFFLDQGVFSAFATSGLSYDFTPTTSGFLSFYYNRFRFDLTQEIDGSQFVFLVPGDDQVPIPVIPGYPAFPSDTTENVIDASQLVAGLLAAEGTFLSTFTTETSLLTGGISHELSPRTGADVQLGYRWIDYQRPDSIGGGDVFASLRLSHTFNTKTDLSGGYTYRRNMVFSPAIDSHSGIARLNRQISVPLRLEGSFGVTYYPLPASGSSGYELVGGGGLSGQYVRTSFNVSYHRRAQHSLGIGRFLTSDLASGGISYIFARDWSATAYAGYRSSRGTFDDSFFFTVFVLGVNATHRINEEFSIGGSYLYRYLDRDPLRYGTHLLSAVLTFGKTWK